MVRKANFHCYSRASLENNGGCACIVLVISILQCAAPTKNRPSSKEGSLRTSTNGRIQTFLQAQDLSGKNGLGYACGLGGRGATKVMGCSKQGRTTTGAVLLTVPVYWYTFRLIDSPSLLKTVSVPMVPLTHRQDRPFVRSEQ